MYSTQHHTIILAVAGLTLGGLLIIAVHRLQKVLMYFCGTILKVVCSDTGFEILTTNESMMDLVGSGGKGISWNQYSASGSPAGSPLPGSRPQPPSFSLPVPRGPPPARQTSPSRPSGSSGSYSTASPPPRFLARCASSSACLYIFWELIPQVRASPQSQGCQTFF